MKTMITREEATKIMKYPRIYEHLRYTFPIVNAFEIKNHASHMHSWDQVINFINGGVVERGKEMPFKCGPDNSVITADFNFVLTLHLSPNTNKNENDRICMEISIKNYNTNWIRSKNYYWQQAEDVAVVYYVASHVVYEQAEDLLSRRKHTMKLTRGLENDIMQSLAIAGLE